MTVLSLFLSSVVNALELIALLLFIAISAFYYRYFTRENPLPGPFPLPLIGSLHIYKDDITDLHERLRRQYGDAFEVWLGFNRRIVLSRSEYVEQIFSQSSTTKFQLRTAPIEGFVTMKISGVGIVFNENLQSWRFNRHIFSQIILSPTFVRGSVTRIGELFEEVDGFWCSIGPDEVINLAAWIHRLTADFSIRTMTGKPSHSMAAYYRRLYPDRVLQTPRSLIEESERFLASIARWMDGHYHFFVYPWYLRALIPKLRRESRSLLENSDWLYSKMVEIVRERRAEIDDTPDEDLPNDLLTSLLLANTDRDRLRKRKDLDEEWQRPMNDDEIRANLLDAFAAGTDTTSNAFIYIVYYLCRYPEVKKRVFAEIDELFGGDCTQPLTNEDLQQLEYCEAVIKEVNRHCPTLANAMRINHGAETVNGQRYSANTLFAVNLRGIHNQDDYYKDPEKFDPERFLDKERTRAYERDNKLVIFGGGARICPGRKLAMVSLKSLMALVYRKYDIVLADPNAPLKKAFRLTYSCDELYVFAKPR